MVLRPSLPTPIRPAIKKMHKCSQQKQHRAVKEAIWLPAGNMIFAGKKKKKSFSPCGGRVVADVWNVCVTPTKAKQYWLLPAIRLRSPLFNYLQLSSAQAVVCFVNLLGLLTKC